MFSELETAFRSAIERIEELESTVDELKNKNPVSSKYLSTNNAYDYIRGNRDVSNSAKWQFIKKLVEGNDIHKFMINGNRMYDRDELESYMQSKRVIGKVV